MKSFKTFFFENSTKQANGLEKFLREKYPQIETIFLSINERSDRTILNLNMIKMKEKKRGYGTKVMQYLISYADDNQMYMYLNPAQSDDRHGTTSRSRLVKFYKRFGFVENKGKHKDFTFIGGMYREPKRLMYENFKAASNDIFYHGTSKSFSKFKGDIAFITRDISIAEIYARDNGKILSVKANLNNTFDTRSAIDEEIFKEEFFQKWGNGSPLINGLPDWSDAFDFEEFFRENDYSYDSVYIREPQGESIAVFFPDKKLEIIKEINFGH